MFYMVFLSLPYSLSSLALPFLSPSTFPFLHSISVDTGREDLLEELMCNLVHLIMEVPLL